MGGKSGKHNPDDVLIGFLDSPEVRALTEIVVELEDNCDTVSDFFRHHIEDRAIAHGVIANGSPVGIWDVRIKVRAAAIRKAKKERSDAIKAKKVKKAAHK